MELTTFDKAIAGGLVSLVATWLARYGLTLSPVVHDAVASIALAVVTYLAGHVAVYYSRNAKAAVDAPVAPTSTASTPKQV